ncbi:hypothetical protein J2X58_000982 [Luteibacter sp. 3190]|nr:hypothetical protein [Luteibacter sp. 3190]
MYRYSVTGHPLRISSRSMLSRRRRSCSIMARPASSVPIGLRRALRSDATRVRCSSCPSRYKSRVGGSSPLTRDNMGKSPYPDVHFRPGVHRGRNGETMRFKSEIAANAERHRTRPLSRSPVRDPELRYVGVPSCYPLLANGVSKRRIAEGKRRVQRCIRVHAFGMGIPRREHEVGQALGFKAEHSEFDAILNQARCPHRELVSIRHEKPSA